MVGRSCHTWRVLSVQVVNSSCSRCMSHKCTEYRYIASSGKLRPTSLLPLHSCPVVLSHGDLSEATSTALQLCSSAPYSTQKWQELLAILSLFRSPFRPGCPWTPSWCPSPLLSGEYTVHLPKRSTGHDFTPHPPVLGGVT